MNVIHKRTLSKENEVAEALSKWAVQAVKSHVDAIVPTIDLPPSKAEWLKAAVWSSIEEIIEKSPWASLTNRGFSEEIELFIHQKKLKPELREILVSLRLQVRSLIKPGL